MTMPQKRASGYSGVSQWFVPQKVLTSLIVENYHDCALLPQIANSNFLSNGEELLCGSLVTYGREQDIADFGYQTDNDESPPISRGADITPESMRICQDFKYRLKLSYQDEQQMCTYAPLWYAQTTKQIDRKIAKQIDEYSLPVIMASANRAMVGKRAGVLTHAWDLGGQGGTGNEPLSLSTTSDAMKVLDSLAGVAAEAGWSCSQGEIEMPGDSVSRPTLVVPAFSAPVWRQAVREYENGCNCGDSSAFRTGRIGNINGFDIIVTNRMQPVAQSGSSWLMQALLVDPSKILHLFHIVSNKVVEREFDKVFALHYIYDTFVTNSFGVAVANIAFTR